MISEIAGKAGRAIGRAKRRIKQLRERAATKRSFKEDFVAFAAEARRLGMTEPTEEDLYPCLTDRTSTTEFEPHYTYHTAWACRELAQIRPLQHVDIGSYLRFCAMAAAWVPLIHLDFRKPNIHLSGLETRSGDILSLPFDDRSVSSLSCMHVLEHIGLGRYGDPLDPLGDVKGACELERVLAADGTLLLVLPVGRSRTNFNAHRVYSYEDVMRLFPSLTLLRSSLVPDDFSNGMIDGPSPQLINSQEWGCGCFVFTRTKP